MLYHSLVSFNERLHHSVDWWFIVFVWKQQLVLRVVLELIDDEEVVRLVNLLHDLLDLLLIGLVCQFRRENELAFNW